MKTIWAKLAAAGLLLFSARVASAAPTKGRVAILGPEKSGLVPRLQRNFADTSASAVVSSCTRVVVAKNLYDLDADTAICTDGDVVSVWKMEDDSVQLIEAVPITRNDERSLELLAARVTIAARSGKATNELAGTIIVDNNDSSSHSNAATILADATASSNPSAERPPVTPTAAPERIAPSVVFGMGPMILASNAGSSVAVSAEAEIGVSRVVTFNPWFATIPVPRDVTSTVGTASYRPTLFGLGFGVPLRSYKKTFVPRLGAGYALIWMRTWPQAANAGATVGESEDLWAPAMYATAALSVGVTDHVRIAAEGLLGTSTHNMVIRMAGQQTDRWGVPLASLGLRAELVLP